MSQPLGSHSIATAWHRLTSLIRTLGLFQTAALLLGALDDKYLRSFDRRYRVRTSGFILLNTTSFDPKRLSDATQYGPANGWAVRRCLRRLDLPRNLHFADLGSGLGRICLLAAEYGFAQVTGVELAPELCATARENVARARLTEAQRRVITIREMDALVFCDTTDADVFFMFRPFSERFLSQILDQLAARACARQRELTIIYSERAGLAGDYAPIITRHPAYRHECDAVIVGQAFHVFKCHGLKARSSHDSAA